MDRSSADVESFKNDVSNVLTAVYVEDCKAVSKEEIDAPKLEAVKEKLPAVVEIVESADPISEDNDDAELDKLEKSFCMSPQASAMVDR